MIIDMIDEVKNAKASADVNDSIEDVNDFLVTASADAAVRHGDQVIKDSHRPLLQGQEFPRRLCVCCFVVINRYWGIATVPGFLPWRASQGGGVAVLCIFSLGWVSWRGVYLLFVQLQQLPSA